MFVVIFKQSSGQPKLSASDDEYSKHSCGQAGVVGVREIVGSVVLILTHSSEQSSAKHSAGQGRLVCSVVVVEVDVLLVVLVGDVDVLVNDVVLLVVVVLVGNLVIEVVVLVGDVVLLVVVVLVVLVVVLAFKVVVSNSNSNLVSQQSSGHPVGC